MQYGTVATGGSQVRRHVRPHVLHPEVRLASRPGPPLQLHLELEGRPQARLPDAEKKQGTAAASCGSLDCASLCNREFAKVREDGLA